MKLPNFLENNIFEEVKSKMNIDDGYVVEIDFNIPFRRLKLDNNRRYTRDWAIVSMNYKEKSNWICEECGLDCSVTKYYLHTHHINNNRYNNSYNNLKAVCRSCIGKY